jgi:hypothetical protein
MGNTMMIIAYTVYLSVAILLTFFVARNLFKNSKAFMLEIFHGKTEIALATNKLFEIGFYLMNLGYILLILRMDYMDNYQEMIEGVSFKLGGISIYLGIMLFLNLYLLFRGRRISKQHAEKKVIETKDPNPYGGYQPRTS